MKFNLRYPIRNKFHQLTSLVIVALVIITNTGLVNAAPNTPGLKSQLVLAHKPIEKQAELDLWDHLEPEDQTSLEPDPTIQNIIVQITTTEVYSLTGDLTGEWPVIIGGEPYTIQTRASKFLTATMQATQFAYEHFESLGLDVTYHTYDHLFYGERRNVIAEQTGVGQPERIFMLTAHMDDAPAVPVAPGADDNASGSVAVMLVAQLLSQYDFDCTLRYALFTGEEQGLLGSDDYAQDISAMGDAIEGVLNLDMIAYESDGQPYVDLHTRVNNNGDLVIANTFVDVVSAYQLTLNPEIHQDSMGRSDHVSFWQAGYPAILAIEDDDDFTPYYHTTNDRLETLNLAYFTNFIKAAVGTLSHLGCMLGTVSGTVTEAESGLPLTGATVEALVNGSVIESATTAPDGSYHLDLVLGSYTLKASQPGYISLSAGDIRVQGALTATQDFALEAFEPILSADFVFHPSPAQVGETVTFTGTIGGGTPPFEYAWDFGEGNLATGQVVEHSYGLDDIYTVIMTATNGAGAITATHDITVEGTCIPVAGLDFTVIPAEPVTGDTVTFTATMSAGTQPVFYEWDFGDGDFGSGSVLTHTFPSKLSPSTYTVMLTADNLCSLQPLSIEKDIVVQPDQLFLPIMIQNAP
jgi:PKD repeat protein